MAEGCRAQSLPRRPTPTSASSVIRAVPHEASAGQGNSGRRPRSAACQATVDAAGGVAAAAAAAGSNRRPPPQLQQITRRNFRSALPEVAAALQGCR